MWIKKAFRDYYKPKLRRELKYDPSQNEMDLRFEEIYCRCNCILLVGVNEGVAVQFYEIARFNKAEVDGFRNNPEEYFADRPSCERLVNKRLNDLRLNIMRDWKIALEEYLLEYYSNYV